MRVANLSFSLPNSLCIAIPVLLGSGCQAPSSEVSTPNASRAAELTAILEDHSDRVMVVAHRGCWRVAPENSLPAIEECVRAGVDMIEIDVRETSDGELVVIHDESVDRTTDGQGLVSELTLEQIRTLRLRDFDGGSERSITKERVPTLSEALMAAKDRILVNLDAKEAVRDKAYEVASQLGVAKQILFKMSLASPDDVDLESTAFFGNVFFMPIIREANGDLVDQVNSFADVDPVAFEVIYLQGDMMLSTCDAAAAQDARCWVNTMWDRLSPGHSDDVAVDDPDGHWGVLIEMGVNMFQTDRPLELVEYLAMRGQ